MAKVTMPLLSTEARGKIANAIVFFPWKGRNIVRRWLTPANPQSLLQMTIRAKLKAIGKAIAKIYTPTDVASGSIVYQAALAKTTSGQPWNAWFAKQVLDHVKVATNWSALTGQFSTATGYANFQTEATALGLVDFALTAGYTENIEAGLQLYMAAYAAYAGELSEYSTDPENWAVTLVTDFATDFQVNA